nr:hypothetical protein [Natrinema sp. CBA1119]
MNGSQDGDRRNTLILHFQTQRSRFSDIVFIAPLPFVLRVYFFAPTSGSGGTSYWLEYWWLCIPFVIGATIVNTVGISGSTLFVPFLIFVFPLFAYPL